VVQRLAGPGDRLFVGPRDLRRPEYVDTLLYHLLPALTPATYFLEMNPGSVDRPGSQLATDIASADWLILNRVWDKAPAGPVRAEAEVPGEVVRTQFTQIFAAGDWEVFCKTARIAQN
jgi:hypothetical protein